MDMITEETILNNIKRIREKNRLSQEFVATALNMKQAGYNLIENGKRKLTIQDLLQIAIILNVKVSELITGNKNDIANEGEMVKAILHIELSRDKKEQVLKIVFGDNNLKVLNE